MGLYEKFSAPIGTHGNALINWTQCSSEEISSYAWSYRCAAMALVSLRERQPFITLDNHALPIMFLYRHSLELYLKALVYRAALVSIDERELVHALPRLWREHSLLQLLHMGAPLFETTSPLGWAVELHSKVRDVAKDLDEIDSGSYAFRYPLTTKGGAALPSHFLTNIFVFSEAVESVLDDLAQYCRLLEGIRVDSTPQMKLALHHLQGNER